MSTDNPINMVPGGVKVYLDDKRVAPYGWIRAYWPQEVIDLIKAGGVTHISLDHDLGDPNRNGYDVILWLEEQAYTTNLRIPDIHLHTANPVAREKMQKGIQSINKALISKPRCGKNT